MSTRWIWGFRKNGKSKYTYAHHDGYPDGAGLSLKQQLHNYSVDYMRARFDKIIVCEEGDFPEPIIIKELIDKGYIRSDIYSNNINGILNWYNILHDWQGNMKPVMEYDLPYFTYADEYTDHEYRYTIDLDSNMFIIDYHNHDNTYEELITIPLLELDEMSDDIFIRECESAEDNC